MTTDDLFTAAKRSNVPEMSVSELAFSLKRTLEETYGRVRVRGELSGLKLAGSGHLYGDLKDEESVINIVCWRGSMSKLSIRPEDGLDVIITGKMTSYPKNSRYQLVIDSMELAGEGALLKMLEERKKKLAAEGLFDPSCKKPIPFLPNTIGVVTSPTGAVIRDIIHRISDRFPLHLLVWPVLVQGTGAAEQIAAAIRGFNAVPETKRPDTLIVARGGGSLEDLMAFNEEVVVRAVADSLIPVISAVGHETDTTLIDYVSDLRAPTPTGAAEMAVPVRLNLLAQVQDDEHRLTRAVQRRLGEGGQKLETLTAKLGDPSRLLDVKTQHLDHLSSKLIHCFDKTLSGKTHKLAALIPRYPAHLIEAKGQSLDKTVHKLRHGFESRLSREDHRLAKLSPAHPRSLLSEKARHVAMVATSLARIEGRLLTDLQKRLDHAGRMLDSLSFRKVLERGYAVVLTMDGKPISDAAQAEAEDIFQIEFRGNQRVSVRKP